MSPRVTVITPTYNRKNLIKEVIESIHHQTFENYEHIIVDDGSVDGTREMIQSLALNRPRIRYFYKENGGEASAVNIGWKEARGDYVVIVNSDDPQPETLLNDLVYYMDAHPGIGVGFPHWASIDESARILQAHSLHPFKFQSALTELTGFPGPGAILRKGALQQFDSLRDGRFPYVTDLGCWLKLGQEVEFGLIENAQAYWRRHEEGLTTTVKNRRLAKDYYDVIHDFWHNVAKDDYKHLKKASMAQTCMKCAHKTFAASHYVLACRYGAEAVLWSPAAVGRYIRGYMAERSQRKPI